MALFKVKTFQIFLLGSDLDDERLEKFDENVSAWIKKNNVKEIKDMHSSINPSTNEYIVTICYIPAEEEKPIKESSSAPLEKSPYADLTLFE